MALTPEQTAILKADIAADPALSAQPMNSDGDFAIAEAYNKTASPNYFVWRSSAIVNDLMQSPFDWTRVDNLTLGKSRIWEWMTAIGAVNPSQANVRAGVLQTFSTASDLPCRQAIFNGGQRLATRAEKLFATGPGTSATDQGVGPSVMGFEGLLSYQDVTSARASGTTRAVK